MDIEHRLLLILCEIGEFINYLNQYTNNTTLSISKKPIRGRANSLSIEEIATILIAFQSSGFRNFKIFYYNLIDINKAGYFFNLPSYNRFVELQKRAYTLLALYSQSKSGEKTGMYYIDSTCLPVCVIQRSSRNKSFKGIANHGKNSMGWFFGIKVHLVINNLGQLVNFRITRGNEHDSSQAKALLTGLKGIACGDKGYIGKKLFQSLFEKGLKLITKPKKNMKSKYLLDNKEKFLLSKRGIIETVINHLKNQLHIWHTRHRSVMNAIVSLFAGLAAYAIKPLQISLFKTAGEIPN